MKVNSSIFWTILIVIIPVTIGSKYLLVAVDVTRDIGMYFTFLQELNTSRVHMRPNLNTHVGCCHLFSSMSVQGKMRAPEISALVATIRGMINMAHGIPAVRLTSPHLLDLGVTVTLRSQRHVMADDCSVNLQKNQDAMDVRKGNAALGIVLAIQTAI